MVFPHFPILFQVFYETGALSACDLLASAAEERRGQVLPEEALRQELSDASGDVDNGGVPRGDGPGLVGGDRSYNHSMEYLWFLSMEYLWFLSI